MIIPITNAKGLIARGDAKLEGYTAPDDRGRAYAILTRYDNQRTDHARDDNRSLETHKAGG